MVHATGNITCYECAQSTLGTVDGEKSGNCFNEDSTTPFRGGCDACYIRKEFLEHVKYTSSSHFQLFIINNDS